MNDRWQAQVNLDRRFYFTITDDTYRIEKVIPHPNYSLLSSYCRDDRITYECSTRERGCVTSLWARPLMPFSAQEHAY